MPPFYDIYAISKNRDKKTIEKFLEYFSFRDKIEDRSGQEIRVYKNEVYEVEDKVIIINTLSEVVDCGVINRIHGFTFYIGDNLKPEINSIILKFTYDEKIIFGVSVEEKDKSKKDNYAHAYSIEKEIVRITNAYESSIQFEYAPSDDENEFYEDKKVWEQMNEEKRSQYGLK